MNAWTLLEIEYYFDSQRSTEGLAVYSNCIPHKGMAENHIVSYPNRVRIYWGHHENYQGNVVLV